MHTSQSHILQQSSSSQASQPGAIAKRLTMYDLPSEFAGEPGLPDEYHDLQPELLSATLKLTQYTAQEWFASTDMCLYYDENHPLWHKRPDWFLAVGVPRLYSGSDLRLSYVVKDEGVAPSVVVELLSPGTEQQDLGPFYRSSDRIDPDMPAEEEIDADLGEGLLEESTKVANDSEHDSNRERKVKPPTKWAVYETVLQVPYYITYSRYRNRMRCFRLVEGQYVEVVLDPDTPRFWLEELQIGLGIWQGEYKQIVRSWLRWFDRSGEWILTETEAALQQVAQTEQQLAEERRLRLELIERLQRKGIDIDTL